MSAVESKSTQLPGYPNISIINNINTKDDKKDDKKGKAFVAGRSLYVGLEIFVVHRDLLNLTEGVGDPIYRPTYLVAMTAGIIFGLCKSITSGQEVGLEQRAEFFGKEKVGGKILMLAEACLTGPVALRCLRSINSSSIQVGPFVIPHLANIVPIYWGFSLGSDISSYAYNSLVSKKSKS